MSSKIFLDTNILVYAYDPASPTKQSIANDIIVTLARNRRGVVSAQILSEFYVTTTKKLVTKMSPEEVQKRIENFVEIFEVFPITSQILLKAICGTRQHNMHFWDALYWSTAKVNNVFTVFTEDSPSSPVLENVAFINPFAANFQLLDWV